MFDMKIRWKTGLTVLAAVGLANKMGPGVVSMSFGANEGNWTASADSYFGTANMTYLAAAGDSGAGVSWPAVSPSRCCGWHSCGRIFTRRGSRLPGSATSSTQRPSRCSIPRGRHCRRSRAR